MKKVLISYMSKLVGSHSSAVLIASYSDRK